MIRRLLVSLCLLGFWSSQACSEITFLNNIRQGFRSPAGADVGPDGEVFVADFEGQRIKELNPDGSTIVRNFFVTSPRDVAVSPALIRNPNGTTTRPLFVVDRDNNQIRRFSETGNSQLEFGELGTMDGQFDGPLGVGVNLIGDVFVADTGNDRIQRFTIDGEFVSSFGTPGSRVGEFNAPSDVVIGPLNEIFVADRQNNRVQKFDNDGNFEFAIGGFDDPTSLAISLAGYLYVADRDNDRIQRFGIDGALQATFGSSGSGNGEFDTPLGVAVSLSGLVYVADSENDRVPRYFDSDAWVRGRNEFTRTQSGPINVGVGSESLFQAELFTRVSLGRSYVLAPLMELVVGANTRIAEDGKLTLAGGELTTDSLQVEGIFEFNSGRLAIGSHGIVLGDDGPFGDALQVGLLSSISLGDALIVGAERNARLRIERGGIVENTDGRIATVAGTLSDVQVDGFGSTWSNSATLVVGDAGRGGIQVSDGGQVSSNTASVGKAANAHGTVSISGFDSRWTNAGDLRIGEAGEGELSVTESGQLLSASASIATLENSVGLVVVSGPASTWANSAALMVGAAGDGGLAVASGGHVSSNAITLGVSASADGKALVSGFGSLLESDGALKVGDAGSGRLLIEKGGHVQSQAAMVGAEKGLGLATLTGVGSRWDISAALDVGSTSAGALGGSLFVGPGSTVTVGANLSVTQLGQIDLHGRIEVADTTAVEAAGSLTLRGGVLATETLTIQSAATMNVDEGTLLIDGNFTNAGEINYAGALLPEITALNFQNTGLVVGGARLNAPLNNQASGELRLGINDRLVATGATNSNGGSISLNGGSMELTGTFENATSGLLTGRGVVRADAGTTNRGDMLFSGGQTDIHGNFLNAGSDALVLSTGGGTTTFFGDVTNQPSAEIRVSEGSSVVFLGTFNGGTTGLGTAIVEGVLSPENSPAAVTFEGNLILTDQSQTILELGGPVAGSEYDQILGKAIVELDGVAVVQTIDDYTGPSRGEVAEYTLVSAEGGRNGFYESMTYDGLPVEQPLANGSLQSHVGDGLFRTVTYSDQELALTDYLALDGDANGDLSVDFSDFLVVSTNFNQPGDWLAGDFDGNGFVRFPDFLLLSNNFGKSVSQSIATVPEPSSATLAVLVCIALLALGRRRVMV